MKSGSRGNKLFEYGGKGEFGLFCSVFYGDYISIADIIHKNTAISNTILLVGIEWPDWQYDNCPNLL